jgi:hypothetical protein
MARLMSFCTRVEKLPGLRNRQEDEGRMLVYNPRSDNLHILGPIEAKIFALCDGRSISKLVEAARTEVTNEGIIRSDAAATEVLGLLNQFKDRELVRFL